MISLLIPTINRSDFIIKYLNYLKENGFQGQVLIGDSSGQEHFCATKNFLKDFYCKFEIKQYSHPNMYPYQCINHMLKDINCPYSMFIPDDDILIPSTLEKCVSYLEENPDYSGVGGMSVLCGISSGDYKKIMSISRYMIRELDAESATDRVYDFASNYTVIAYTLARTEQFKKRFPEHSENFNVETGNELMPCVLLAAQGKVKMLDELFVVRQIHQRRILLPAVFDSILKPHWASSTTYFIEYLSRIVAEEDSISYDEAYPVAKKAIEQLLIRQIISKYSEVKSSFWKKPSFRSAIKSIPGSKKTINKLRSLRTIFTASRGEISLQALLNSSSPYNEDFVPAYKSITQSRESSV